MAFPASFHPLVVRWFAARYGAPTAVQEEAWPLIERGENVLAVAPTGSGKTLAAFLAAVSRFIGGSWDSSRLCCLYVSPLKALNEDIRRNLEEPIAELAALAAGEGTPLMEGRPFPDIRVQTRSGDTPQAERRRFLLHPPSILAVTPESLAILLLNPAGRAALSTVRFLVLDELHAVMGTKRGAFLSCQIDRLARCAGDFRRIALSATACPLRETAEFAGAGRIVAPENIEKNIDFRIVFPDDEGASDDGEDGSDTYGRRYTILTNFILDRIAAARAVSSSSTLLVFTDSRRRAERISFLLNKTAAGRGLYGGRVSLCHHGSLSKEVRRDVEKCLASALIPCVVATSSLELGLDIGAVDEVILAGGVSSCAQALQRIGRAGHGVGRTSRAFILPFHPTELVAAAALYGAVRGRDIEETHAVKNPLDILAQIILALLLEKEQTADELFAVIRGFAVFADLGRPAFDGVVSMLSGRCFGERGVQEGAETERLRELKPRLYIDIDGTCRAAAGTAALLYSSGGVIPNRGLYSMRLADGTKIGELDEEFVFERRTGDRFDFGSRSWMITEIGGESVTVVPSGENAGFQPFWKAESQFRSRVLTRRVLELFDAYEQNRAGNRAASSAASGERLPDGEAKEALGKLLEKQVQAQGAAPLPGTARIPVEIIDNPAIRPDSCQAVFHTFRGGAVNYPLAFALAALLEEMTGTRIETIPDDNAVLLIIPRIALETSPLEELLRKALARLPAEGENRFLDRLESSGVFGAAFRETAERGLLLPRGMFGRRVPLWLTRQRAKRLYDRVSRIKNFPLTTEALRSCLSGRFDMEAFRALLEGVAGGGIRIAFFHSRQPSPFARDFVWKETAAFMYEYDERADLLGRAARRAGNPSDWAIAGALADPEKRPSIGGELAAAFGAKLRRELEGWTPEDRTALAEWVRERIIIPPDEWNALLEALPLELRNEVQNDPSLGGRLAFITGPSGGGAAVTHTEYAGDAKNLSRLGQWLRYEGPVSVERIAEVFGCTAAEAEDAASALDDAVYGVTVNGEEGLYCDSENFERLLRLARKKARPEIRERPAALLAPYLAMRQGILAGDGAPPPAAVLSCLTLPARLWETEVFPCRDRGYRKETLDKLLAEGRLVWFGNGRENIGFCAPDELDLARRADSPARPANAAPLAAFCQSYRNFWEIRDELVRAGKAGDSGAAGSNSAAAALLWEAVWEGTLSSDSFEAPRRGLEQGFALKEHGRSARDSHFFGSPPPELMPPGLPRRARTVPRALREKWRAGAPVPGNWFSLLPEPAGVEEPELSALEEEELNQDRVRLLAGRWGVLAKPLLEREDRPFSWQALLPAMRRMELSGELVSGRFFAGIRSVQFASPSIAAELEAAEEAARAGAMYWMNAADPASPAGLAAEGLSPRLPPRTQSARLCFRGAELAAVSSKSGRNLEIFAGEGDTDMEDIIAFVIAPRKRLCFPVKNIALETINGRPAAQSPWAGVFRNAGFIADRGKLAFW